MLKIERIGVVAQSNEKLVRRLYEARDRADLKAVRVFIDWPAERDGARIEGKEVAVYWVRDGKIVEAFFHVDDPDDDREFWK